MVNHSLTETYDNDSHFDLTFIICVWVTFLPTVSSNLQINQFSFVSTSSKVTLPWFYAHWILIGSLSRVLLAELFSSNSPGFYLFYHNVFDSSSIKLQGKDKGWQTRRDKYLEQKQRDSATGKMLIKCYSFSQQMLKCFFWQATIQMLKYSNAQIF